MKEKRPLSTWNRVKVKESEVVQVMEQILNAMPISHYGNIPYENVPECVEPLVVPLEPSKLDTESSGEDTDIYWPLEETDPVCRLIVIPDEIIKPTATEQP